MDELIDFYRKLSGCDMIVVTPINKGRFYCRFYSEGLYLDRMFITDLSLQEELVSLSGGNEIIDKDSVTRLKEKYTGLAKTTGEEKALEDTGGD